MPPTPPDVSAQLLALFQFPVPPVTQNNAAIIILPYNRTKSTLDRLEQTANFCQLCSSVSTWCSP
jgi:hypothetical protein